MNTFIKKPRPNPWFKIVAIISIALILILIVYFLFIGKGKKKYDGMSEKAMELLVPQITQLTIEPSEAYSVDSLRAVPVLKRPVKTVSVQYKWYVDGDLVPGEETNLLPYTYFKRGDKVYCRAIATQEKYQSEEMESPTIEIKNSNPVIDLISAGSFAVPGHFQYQITASDPDGDTLNYQLVSPLNLGIIVNERTGVLEWDIPAPRHSESANSFSSSTNVDIVFQVRDSGGATTSASLSLNLSKGKEDPV